MAESRPPLPTGTVTFLFTDIEGSTRLLQRFGDGYPEMLETHAALMRHAIAAAGGVEVSTEGDAFFVVFQSAAAAAQFASEAQRGLAEHPWPEGGEIRVRMGMHTGLARLGGDNYVGLDVHRAARVAAVAHGGQVVLTADARQAMDPVPDLLDLGEHHLKDLVTPEHIYQLVIPGTRSQFPPLRVAPQVPEALRTLPAPLDPVDPVFVGRSAELATARGWWRRAQAGAPSTGWVVGPSGIGKTRLAAELASDLFRSGVPVLYGSALPRTSSPLASLNRAFAALGLDAGEFASSAGSPNAGGRDLGAAAARALPSPGTLIVLDDLDSAHSDLVAMTSGLCEGLGNLPVLVVLIASQPSSTAATDRLIQLGPLSHQDAVRIAALYAGEDQAEIAAADIAARASGVPAALHIESASWMRERTRTLLEREATMAAQRRDDLDTARGQLAGAISGLQELADRVGAHTRDAESESQCPYMGLSAFDESDARFFFGREDLVRALLVRFNDTPVLGVTGPSGSGKSSLVRAGLLPALRDGLLPGGERWRTEVMIPEEHPLAQLREIMDSHSATRHAVLFVDQFERVFTECSDPNERIAFLDRLAAAAASGTWRVVVSIRSDYFGEPAVAPEFSRLLGEGTILAGPMRLEDLQRAIELPARRVGLTFEPGLAASIAADVADRPGALPLLSAALVELWEKRRGRTLSALAYYQGGGVQGAVARLAEDAYGRLDAASQAVARRMLLRMAGPGSADAVVARRVPLSEIRSEGPVGRAVLDLLVERRLVTVDGEAFQVAHEALLRDWPRLREWLDGDRQGRELHAHLIAASQQWERGGRQRSDLYRGARLAAAVDWAGEEPEQINDLERQFLDAAHLQSQEEAENERRTNRRLRRFLLGLAVSLVVAGVAGGLALAARSRAQDRAIEAEAARLGAEALLVEDLDLSLLLSVEANALDGSSATQGAMLASILRSPQALTVFRHPGVRLLDTAISPDGRLLATAANSGDVTLWDLTTGSVVRVLEPTAGATYWVGFTPDGASLVAFDDETFTVWDVATGTFSHLFTSPFYPRSVAIDPGTGELVLSAEGRLLRIEIASGSVNSEEEVALNAEACCLAISPDGGTLLLVSETGGALIRRGGEDTILEYPSALSCRGEPPDLEGCVSAAATNGRYAAVADMNTLMIRVIDLDTNEQTAVLTGHTDFISELVFIDETRLLSASNDRTLAAWDVVEQRRIEVFSGHSGNAMGVAVAPDDATAYSVSQDGTAMAWDLDGARRFGEVPFTLPPGFTWPPYLSQGREVVVTGLDGVIRHLDLVSGDLREYDLGVGPLIHVVLAADRSKAAAVSGDSPIVYFFDPDDPTAELTRLDTLTGSPGILAFNADASLIAVGKEDRTEIWDVASGAMLADFDVEFGTSAFSPDGAWVAIGGDGGEIRIIRQADWREHKRIGSGLYVVVFGIAFSPDGSLLASATADGRLRLWDPETGDQIGPDLVAQTGFALSVQFSSDGSRMVTSGTDGAISVWDTASLQRVGSPLVGNPGVWGWGWFLRDADEVAALYEDGIVRVWDLHPDALAERACAIANRPLSEVEWEQYLRDRDYTPGCGVATDG